MLLKILFNLPSLDSSDGQPADILLAIDGKQSIRRMGGSNLEWLMIVGKALLLNFIYTSRKVLDPNGVLTGCLGRATLALPIFLGRLVCDTIRLVGSAVAAQVLVEDKATLFPVVCVLLHQANPVFDGIGLRVCKGLIEFWELRSHERREHGAGVWIMQLMEMGNR